VKVVTRWRSWRCTWTTNNIPLENMKDMDLDDAKEILDKLKEQTQEEEEA
jgi:hypothetical protein